jgi:hypothetical protein
MKAPLVPSNCLENTVKEDASCADNTKSGFRNSWCGQWPFSNREREKASHHDSQRCRVNTR